MNLNDLTIEDDGSHLPARNVQDNSTLSSDRTVTVYFRELEQHLIRYIAESRLVVGCVAWLTSETILQALAEVPDGVAIVVQKEDFLRPDLGSRGDWKFALRRRYDALREPSERFLWNGLVGSLSVCIDPAIRAVRCIGNHNKDKKPAFPRMHNKFLVFCDVDQGSKESDPYFQVKPRAVWTGSFNFTKNAAMSLENALVLTDPLIVEAYYREWEQILALSEPLDWTSEWTEPEWRIGS